MSGNDGQQASLLDAAPATAATIAAIERFNVAFNSHDVDAIMGAMTDDCIFAARPPPDGRGFKGQAEVRAAWEGLFRPSPDAVLQTEELFAVGDRCVVRWRYQWVDAQGQAGHIRGVDLFRDGDGKGAENIAYA